MITEEERDLQSDHNGTYTDDGFVAQGEAWIRNKVQDLRRTRGLSRKEFAKATMINHRTVTLVDLEDYEPSLSVAYRLADFFGTSVETVFWREFPGDVPHPDRARIVLEVPHPAIENRHSRLQVLNWLLDSSLTRNRDMLLGLLRSFEDEEKAADDLAALIDAALIAEDPAVHPTPSLLDRLLSRKMEPRVPMHLTPAGRQAVMQAYAHGAGDYERARRHHNIEPRYLRILGQYPGPVATRKLEDAVGYSGKRVTWETEHLQAHGLARIENTGSTRSVALTDAGRERYATRYETPSS